VSGARVNVFRDRGAWMLRIERAGNGGVLFTISGRIETAEVNQLQQLLALEGSGHQLSLDLKDVTLVNQEAVEFLARCEASGIRLEQCPRHIRRWIAQLKGRIK
jgi:anti-anti-sigma regulatory factor